MNRFVGDAFGQGSADWYDALVSTVVPAGPTVDFLVETLPQHIGTDLRHLEVLEIGVGTARVAAPLAEHVARLVGTDVSTAMVEAVTALDRPRLTAVVHDITAGPTDEPFDAAYCVLNTFFMLGTTAAQSAALTHLRASVEDGGLLVLEVFSPHDEYYDEDSLIMEPQAITDDSVLLNVTQHHSDARRILTQSIVLRDGHVSLTPSSFHYQTVGELDLAAGAAGWSLLERWSNWAGRPFTAASPNSISVYRAT